MFFVSNLRSFSQAGRRGFESRLPLHVFNSLEPVDHAFVLRRAVSIKESRAVNRPAM